MAEPSSIRCLVVDDQEIVRSAIARGLARRGCTCVEAATGREALELLHREPPHVIVSDIQMPEMDGVQLLQAVRASHPDIEVIMVTGVAELDTAVDCLRQGAFDYIVKPFQMEQLRQRVRQAVERRQLLLENRRYQEHLADLVRQQARRIEELFLEGIQSIVHALEAKDRYTRGHSVRVAAFAEATARRLGLDDDTVQIVRLGAELHDVGKIGVSETVLQKPGPLTPEEYRHIMEHTVIGARIMAPLLKGAEPALEIIRWHHERLDGHGLPDGLRDAAIPLHARIVTVADAFDAMTTGRPYRAGLSPAAATTELRACAETQFDPEVIAAFEAVCRETPPAVPSASRLRTPRGVVLGADLLGEEAG